ncbi:MAG: hypothetical protein WC974_09010 [Thermoplasmata archaeon]
MELEKKVEEDSSATDEKEEKEEEHKEEKEEKKDDFDYKSEFEKLKGNKEKKDYAWNKLHKENKDLKDKLKELGGEEVKEDVRDIIKEEISGLRSELLSNKSEVEIAKLTDNQFGRELIKLNLERFPGMSIEEAWFLANRGRLEGQMSELKKTTLSKERKGSGSGAGQKDQKSTEPQLSPDDVAVIQRMGLKWDGNAFTKPKGRFGLKLEGNKLVQIKT